ncbi:hypothetical protein [Intestinibacter bartlettii]|uniref:Replication initiator A N-terminal domain-containing protein n=1 Tax=Intestinibacter bartlettii TaxID=261299 RepID=A0ABS6DZK3_9FIRM|nr:hypothetical protein [Intestinibacter bartlettii]MBU5337266.1 hypothetical protein [Intestinibacter bartlettii]
MKYTIMGFSQKAAYELGLDVTDLVILRWFVDFKDSGKMRSVLIDDEKYYWVFYKKLAEDIFILSFCKDTFYKRLKRMCDLDVLKKKKVCYGGNYVYYALGKNYSKLIRFEYNSKSAKSDQVYVDNTQNCDNLGNAPYFIKEYNEDFCDNTNDFNCNYNDSSSNMDDFNHNYNDLSNNINNFNRCCGNLSSNIDKFSSDYGDSSSNIDNFSRDTGDLGSNYDGFNLNPDDLNSNIDDFNHNYNDFKQNVTDLNPNLKDIAPNLPAQKPNLRVINPNLTDQNPEQIINLLNKSNKKDPTTKITPEFFLSELLLQLIQKNNPNFKKANFDDWEHGFKVLLYEDGKDYMEILHLLRWVHLEAKSWSNVILSPLDLRDHYDEISAQRKASKAKIPRRNPWDVLSDYGDISHFS